MEPEKKKQKQFRQIPRDPETKRKAAERVNVAVECISQGMPQAEIVKKLCTEYKANWRVAYTNIRKARERLGIACVKRGTDAAIGEAIAKAESHYVRCVKAGDNAAGLATLKHLAMLTGAMQLVESHVQQQIQQLRVQFDGGGDKSEKHKGELTVTAFNAARSVYGIPALTDEQYEEYKRAHQRRQVIVVPNDTSGASNGSGGNGAR